MRTDTIYEGVAEEKKFRCLKCRQQFIHKYIPSSELLMIAKNYKEAKKIGSLFFSRTKIKDI